MLWSLVKLFLQDVYHFQLSHGNMMPWYHTRIRPMTEKFLENVSKLYELHICTFGSRMYAHIIAKFLDPDGKYFSHRILSRDECFNQNSKMANLKYVEITCTWMNSSEKQTISYYDCKNRDDLVFILFLELCFHVAIPWCVS